MFDYSAQLDSAISAAREAGALLLGEFYRPGGPRGTAHKADADGEAEDGIFAALNAAFPGYGFRGEERGLRAAVRDPAGHCWLVDPNDGTSGFFRGYRGAAVSIALLREGQPVLGVVFAYAAPDDSGDLITWAEGQGPVHRNGQPVSRVWPDAVDSSTLLLVSQHGDRRAEITVTRLAPMRYLCLPSIAYRLALVAAGEGDATTSIHTLSAWDIAAGHALLRSAGADLVDGSARPVAYGRDGSGECEGRCLAGPPPLIRHLASFKLDPPNTPLPPPDRRNHVLAVPVRDRKIARPECLSRAQGALLGAALSGAPPAELATGLARCLADHEAFEPLPVIAAYRAWLASNPSDPGAALKSALGGGAKLSASEDSSALIRAVALGVWGSQVTDDHLDECARLDAAITHPHAHCQEASAVLAAAVAFAVRTGAGPRQVFEHAVSRARLLKRLLLSAEAGPPRDFETKPDWVLVALHNAFHRLLAAHSFEAGVSATLESGGQVGINAAVAGGLLGAVHGRAAIPFAWRIDVLTRRPVPGTPAPRPREYWTCDALLLAERLLLAGGAR
ncbi:MAG: ADP-ribosylation/Crystallin J1 [Acidobacteria bacterium]|nr:ADP-ribosylation/Crystallin J1 [Acidobacteriota bacterium]